MSSLIAWVLHMIGWLCRPRARLSAQDCAVLAAAYAESGIDHEAFTFWRVTNAQDHFTALSAVVTAHPEWVVPDVVHEILSGSTRRQVLGAAVYRAFVSGTDCHCCLGWRVVALACVSAAAGALVAKMF